MLAERIAKNLTRLREKRGWSRGQLGQKLTPQVPRQTIEKLEKGATALSVSWIERLAVALDADPAELVAGEDGEFILDEQVASEAARTLGRVVLRGAEPDRATVEVLSLMIPELFEMFARFPATRTDLEALRPVIDLLTRQYGKKSS